MFSELFFVLFYFFFVHAYAFFVHGYAIFDHDNPSFVIVYLMPKFMILIMDFNHI